MGPLPLGAALKRGALVTAANWPVVLVDLVVESLYKLTLAVPVIGGAVMVAAIVGTDLQAVVGEGVRATADIVIGSLATAPGALVSFLIATAIVGLGGEAVMAVVKAGTLRVLVTGERQAGDLERGPFDQEALQQAKSYTLGVVYEGAKHFASRSVLLAVGLGAIYLGVATGYVFVLSSSFTIAAQSSWTAAWPVLVLATTSVAVVTIAVVNFFYDLLRVIIVTDDCGIIEALRRTFRFLVHDARQVLGIFCVMGGVSLVVTAAGLFAATGLTIVPWLPFVGLAMLPLQAVGWMLRGLVEQFVALAAIAAYQTQYRRLAS